MAISVFDWNSDPATDRRLYPLSNARGDEMVWSGAGTYITVNGRRCIQKTAPAEVHQEKSARNQVLPYGRGPVGLINAPPKLRYPIPAVADHRLRWQLRFMAVEIVDAEAAG